MSQAVECVCGHYLCAVPRIASIDYGTKRTGIAISDPTCMIANALETVGTAQLLNVLKNIYDTRGFDKLVVGKPKRLSGEDSGIETEIMAFISKFAQMLPQVEVVRLDERFTSKIAAQTMIAAGASRKQRMDKGNLDKISATLLLQEYLDKQRKG